MKVIGKKTQWAILKALIRNWKKAIKNGRVCKWILMSTIYFTDVEIREIVRELILQDGDWWLARKAIVERNKSERMGKIIKWFDNVKGGGDGKIS